MRRLHWALILLGVLAVGVFAGLIIAKRLREDRWAMPDGDDMVRLGNVFTAAAPRPPRVIYLHRGALEVERGDGGSSKNQSTIVGAAKPRYPLRGFTGKDTAWKELTSCVRKLFSPFDVEVTTERPRGDGYVLVAFASKASDIGITQRRVGGLAPYDSAGGVVPDPVVFAFSGTLGNRTRVICETIGMEVAHVYGLDHAYLCSDVMTYLPACGARSFRDHDARCGEKRARDCSYGAPTQNSYQRLRSVLGPARGAAAPP